MRSETTRNRAGLWCVNVNLMEQFFSDEWKTIEGENTPKTEDYDYLFIMNHLTGTNVRRLGNNIVKIKIGNVGIVNMIYERNHHHL